MLGVFLLPAFTLLGHECQELCDGVESETMLPPGEKIPSTGGSEQDRTRDAASRRTASPTHFQLGYSGPHDLD